MRGRSTPALIPLTPHLRRYDWGDHGYIQGILSLPADDTPCAEAWYGAHPTGPSEARLLTDRRPLDAVLAHDPDLLGPSHEALPFLLKILAAARPLSIQVHPNAAQAAAGFAAEQAAGVPLDAPHRRFRDPHHKPELLVALTPFEALCGFRALDEIAEGLAGAPELTDLLPPFEPSSQGLLTLIERWFELSEGAVRPALGAWLDRLAAAADHDAPPHLALRLQRARGGVLDRGLIFALLLAPLTLQPGEAMFLPAGVPHAYLKGAGLELMASSDNVLRAGLTGKHVDPQALLEIVRPDARRPQILTPQPIGDGEVVYCTPTADFQLRRLSLAPGEARTFEAQGPEILLVLGEGAVSAQSGAFSAVIGQGEGCLVPHGAACTLLSAEGAQVYRARVPGGAEATTFRGRQPTPLAFGTSGLRGLVTDITDLEAYINARGFFSFLIDTGDAVPGTPVALGGDRRPSTEGILRAVIQAAKDADLQPVYCGRLPTPALTYYAVSQGWPSVMVTGSHIPFDRNGIKFNTSRGEILKHHEAPILAAVAEIRRQQYALAPAHSPFDDAGALLDPPPVPPAVDDAAQAYRARYLTAFPADALAGLRVGFYAHSAVGQDLIPDLLRDLGAEVHVVGASTTFVAIDTEAIGADQLQAMQRLVDDLAAEVGPLDALVSTDGDSDRPLILAVADGVARFCGGDVLGAVVADALGAKALAVPVSANDLIDAHFRDATVRRTRIGSPWVIAAMDDLARDGVPGPVVGWEANGGFLTGAEIQGPAGPLAPLATRDAVLPLVAALYASRGQGLGRLIDALPRRFSGAGLLDEVARDRSLALVGRLRPHGALAVQIDGDLVQWRPVEGGALRPATAEERDQTLAVARFIEGHLHPGLGFGPLAEINALDGVRMRFGNGDVIHIRPSGNAPQLRVYATADDPERVQALLDMALAEPDGLLRALLR